MAQHSSPPPPFAFDNSYAHSLKGFYAPWQGAQAPSPRIELFNAPLAEALGMDPAYLGSQALRDHLAQYFSGSAAPQGAEPLAQAYAGHQFGGFSPQLGDGRALLLGEVLDDKGQRFDLHLKGSGPTPFSRGGDGKAVLGPVLREYLFGEAMHALGIPTTRALAAVSTGERVMRKQPKPGAVLARIASSHIRVGTFQFFAARGEWDKVQQLADYTIARHYPQLNQPDGGKADNPYLGLLEAVVARQAELVANWMLVGFVHGVMNTDNMALSGETIDYGPCAFMDHYALDTVFSSIDHTGRYSYGNQPVMARWNLVRFAETLVPLIDPQDEPRAINLATDKLADFIGLHKAAWLAGVRRKIGLVLEDPEDDKLVESLFSSLSGQHVDYTGFFRALGEAASGPTDKVKALFAEPEVIEGWLRTWRTRLALESRSLEQIRMDMEAVNPVYIPRNHLVEEALAAAEDAQDLAPFRRLLELLMTPFARREGFERFETPAPEDFGQHVTYCGT